MFKLLSFKSEGAFWPMAEQAGKAPATRGVVPHLLATPRRLMALVAAEMAARRTMHTLAGLDDRILKDIGIPRDQIWHVAHYGRDVVMQSKALRADFARW
jgi:uncharacterized protein YjiS (DUF1127 family)